MSTVSPPAGYPRYEHFGIIFQCIFCREDVRRQFPPPYDTMNDVRYFLALRETSDDTIYCVGESKLADFNRLMESTRRLRFEEVAGGGAAYFQTCSANEGHGTRCVNFRFETREYIHVVHECCCRIADIRRECVDEFIDLAVRLRQLPHANPRLATERQMLFPLRLAFLRRGRPSCRNTELSQLLISVSKLPQELADMITTQLHGTVVGVLLKAQRTVLEFAPVTPAKVFAGTPETRSLELTKGTGRMYAQTRNTLGEAYLSSIGLVEIGGALSIPISPQNIRQVQYAMSAFGLRALRFIHSDRSLTPWLGDPSSCWLGILPTQDLVLLQTLPPDLHIVALQQKNARVLSLPTPSQHRVRARTHVLWDTDMSELLGLGRSAQLYPTTDWTPDLRYLPATRLCHHLPFLRHGEYMSGLTVYCSKSGILGMRSHFQTGASALVGHQQGYALHFALAKGEYLTSAWVNMNPGNSLVTQSQSHNVVLLVTTNRLRTHYFGSGNARAISAQRGSQSWVCLSQRCPSKLLGFVLDISVFRDKGVFQEIGVTEDIGPEQSEANSDSTSHYPVLETTGGDRAMGPDIERDSFLTSGSLRDTAKILVRKKRFPDGDVAELLAREGHDRLVGLQIIHTDGLIDTLGRWDPDDLDSISSVYDLEMDGRLEVLEFRNKERFPHFQQIITRQREATDPDLRLPFVQVVFPRTTAEGPDKNAYGYGAYSPHLLVWSFGTWQLPTKSCEWDIVCTYEPQFDPARPEIRPNELEALF